MSEPEGGRTLGSVIRTHAAERPAADVILGPGRRALSWAELEVQCRNIRHTLNGWGIGRGDRVALVLSCRADMAAAILCIADCATCVPLNPGLELDACIRQLSAVDARALIVDAGTAARGRAAARGIGLPVFDLVTIRRQKIGSFTLTAPAGTRGEACRAGVAMSEDIAVLVQTSGTTGAATIVPFYHGQFVRQAHVQSAWLRLTQDDRCVSTMPMFNGAGINSSLMMSLVRGGSVVCMEEFSGDDFFGCVAAYHPTWFTASPVYHHEVLSRADRHRDTIAASRLRFIRSASGPLHDRIQQELEATFGVPVLQCYGQSETMGTVTCNPLPPARRKPGTAGVPIDAEVAIVDEGWSRLPAGCSGEIVVRGPSVVTALQNGKSISEDGWLRTGDVGSLDEDGYLTITGRVVEMINRGGQKITPGTVEAVLARHSAVRSVKVFGIFHPTLGDEVAAAVSLHDGHEVTERTLRSFAKGSLPPGAVPKKILILDELPMNNAMRKPDRAALVAMMERELARSPASAGAGRGAVSSAEEAVIAIWRSVLERDDVGLEDDFFTLGGDSLKSVELLLRVEQQFHVDLDAASVYDGAATAAGMARLIEQRIAERR